MIPVCVGGFSEKSKDNLTSHGNSSWGCFSLTSIIMLLHAYSHQLTSYLEAAGMHCQLTGIHFVSLHV